MSLINLTTSTKSKLKLKLKPLLLFMMLPLALCALLPLTASSALKATTAKTMQGSAPYLLLKDGEKLLTLDELLGFTMPRQDGSEGTEQIDATMASRAITAPSGMRFQDITALVAVDGQLHDVDALVGDDDGDALNGNVSVSGRMSATWSDGGKVVSGADLSKTLSACGGPYTLTMKIPEEVSVSTRFGNPHTNTYGTNQGVTYTFTSAGQGICYLQPGSMKVNTGKENVNIKYANGYNSDVWESGKGFKASSGFPTTGFNKAKFNVIGSGSDQSHYRCRVDPGSWVDLSGSASEKLGQNCTVTYNTVKKPTASVTIYLDYNVSGGSDWKQIDTYTISEPKPERWVMVKGTDAYNTDKDYKGTYPAATLCGAPESMKGLSLDNINTADGYFLKRNKFSNAPQANSGYYSYNGSRWEKRGTPAFGGYFSRDVDGTITGEWGDLFNSYSTSGFDVKEYAFTAESGQDGIRFVVQTTNGAIQWVIPINKYVAVCTS